MMHPVAWRLIGFAIFLLLGWGALTAFLMLPEVRFWDAAWYVAGLMIIKVSSLIMSLTCVILAVSWLVKPAEQD